MSDFLDHFSPDEDSDLAELRRIWMTEKPILQTAVVAYAPPYPDFRKKKHNSKKEGTTDPSCPSARDASDRVEVAIYTVSGNGFGSYQQLAWEYLTANTPTVEANLRRKLLAKHLKMKQQFLEEDLPDFPKCQTYWQQIESEIAWDEASAVDHLFKLVGISLIDSGLDDHGFVAFEFQTGWDQDHGLSILMHQHNVLAAGGMGEFTAGGDLVEGAKSVQGYDFDPGDLSL